MKKKIEKNFQKKLKDFFQKIKEIYKKKKKVAENRKKSAEISAHPKNIFGDKLDIEGLWEKKGVFFTHTVMIYMPKSENFQENF